MYDKIKHSLATRGLRETLTLSVLQVYFGLRFLYRKVAVNPVYFYRKWRWQRNDRLFDRAHGIDTTSDIPLHRLAIDSPNIQHGVQYGPTPRGKFAHLIAHLDAMGFDYPQYTFLDFGSGKGRALLLASERPFRRIIGVEFSGQLVAAARENLAAFHSPAQQCFALETLQADVVEYPLPQENLAVYIYNPFDEVVMVKVLENLEHFKNSQGKQVFLLYINPVHDAVVNARSMFHEIARGPSFALYAVGDSAS